MDDAISTTTTWDSGSGMVHARLIQLIVDLELEPGALISETRLIQQLGTDRIELRSALKKLEQARLVSTIPRVGIAIAPLGFPEIQTVFEARFGLEGYTARLGATRATDAEVQELRALVSALHAAGEQARHGEPGAASLFLERDYPVHLAVVKMARNPILEEAMRSILIASARIWNAFFRYAPSAGNGSYVTSHDDLLGAIAARDPDAAEVAVRDHLDVSWSMVRATFDAIPGAALARNGQGT